MSTITATRSTLNAALTDMELDLARLVKVGATNWRSLVKVGDGPFIGETWDREGIRALLRAAQDCFESETGHILPHNLPNQGRWVSEAWGRKHLRPESRRGLTDAPSSTALSEALSEAMGLLKEEAHSQPVLGPCGDADPVEEAARMAGFIRHAVSFPALVRLIRRTTSSRGINSPSTTLNLNRVAQRYSPGAAERQIRKVTARANEILRPHGLRVSYTGIACALQDGPRKVGKAAVVAAAVTLQGHDGGVQSYRGAREVLARLSSRAAIAVVNTEGDVALPKETVYKKGGTTIVRGMISVREPFRRIGGFVVAEPGRMAICYGWYGEAPEDLLKEAEKEWGRGVEAGLASRSELG